MTMFTIIKYGNKFSLTFEDGIYRANENSILFFSNKDYEKVRNALVKKAIG